MEVSIVVPVYNRKVRVRKVVESLLQQQTDIEYEIVLVDDGSSDASCDEYTDNPKIRVIKQINSGAAVARHTGTINARGSVIIFHDSDDIAERNKVAVLTKALKEHPECIAAFALTREERDDWKTPPWIKSTNKNGYFIFAKPLKHFMKETYPIASAMNIALKKEVAIIATADSAYYRAANDFHMQARAAKVGAFVATAQFTTNYFEDSENSLTKKYGTKKQLMFSIFSSVEVYEMLKKKEKQEFKSILKNKVTIHGPTVIVSLLKSRELGKRFIKMIYLTLKYSKYSKLPRSFYWAINPD